MARDARPLALRAEGAGRVGAGWYLPPRSSRHTRVSGPVGQEIPSGREGVPP